MLWGQGWELENQTHLRASHLSALERARPTTYDVGQIEVGDKVVEWGGW